MKIQGKDISLWIDTTPKTDFPILEEDLQADAAIVGGGLAGITLAYLLSKEGMKVVIIDKKRIVEKTTGNTTAKVTSLHGLIYSDLIKRHGEYLAGLYGEANQSGVELVKQIASEEDLDADLIVKSAFSLADSKKDKERLVQEYKAVERLGLSAQFLDKLDLPFEIFGAIEFTNQAQFHPRKYLLALADLLLEKGVQFYENTEALEVADGAVITEKGKIKAEYIVAASHLPFFASEEFKRKMSRSRDYVIAAKIAGELPNGMFISVGEDYHSIRTQAHEGGELLIIDGGWHGLDEREILEPQHYLDLQKWTRENFEVKDYVYYWSTYDWDSPDRIPLAGHYGDNLYLATGFGGWGMSNGTAAAKLIADLILERENPYKDLYDPKRTIVKE